MRFLLFPTFYFKNPFRLLKLNAPTLFSKVIHRKIEYCNVHRELNSQNSVQFLDWLFTKIDVGKVSTQKNFEAQKYIKLLFYNNSHL